MRVEREAVEVAVEEVAARRAAAHLKHHSRLVSVNEHRVRLLARRSG